MLKYKLSPKNLTFNYAFLTVDKQNKTLIFFSFADIFSIKEEIKQEITLTNKHNYCIALVRNIHKLTIESSLTSALSKRVHTCIRYG